MNSKDVFFFHSELTTCCATKHLEGPQGELVGLQSSCEKEGKVNEEKSRNNDGTALNSKAEVSSVVLVYFALLFYIMAKAFVKYQISLSGNPHMLPQDIFLAAIKHLASYHVVEQCLALAFTVITAPV